MQNKITHTITVASGKGGVGKSTTAMNLAVALSVSGKKVGLLDADIYGPSQPRMLGAADAKPQSDGQRIDPVIAQGIKLMSMGFLVDEGDPTVWRGPLVQRAILQMLNDVNWGTLDVLVIDMPPGTGDAQLAIGQQANLSGAVIVSTPQDIALIDAKKALSTFQKLGVPVIGLVENMSTFICPHCEEETHIFDAHGAKKAAKEAQVPLVGEIPLDLAIREGTDSGKPVIIHNPDSPQAEAYRQMAENVWQELEKFSKDISGPVKVRIE